MDELEGIDRDTLTAALLSSIFTVREWWLHPYVPEKGRVFIDVGANVGSWTKWLADRFEWVHAIEPNPSVIEELRLKIPRNVTVHECAAWGNEYTKEFTRFASPDHLSGYFKKEFLVGTGPAIGTVGVPCQRLDNMSIHGHVDFIKIDTEGGEVEVVKGARNMLSSMQPRLMIEIHSSANWCALQPILASLGYETLLIRHPMFQQMGPVWAEHFWVDCRPRA